MGFHPQPFSHLGSLTEKDPKSAGPCVTTAQKPTVTIPLPSTTQAHTRLRRQYLVGKAGPSISGHCFCRRAAPLPPGLAWPRKALAPPVPLYWAEEAGLPAAQPPQLPVQHAPALAGRSEGAVSWLASRRGGGRREGRRREEAVLLLSAKSTKGGETTTFPPSQLFSPN